MKLSLALVGCQTEHLLAFDAWQVLILYLGLGTQALISAALQVKVQSLLKSNQIL